MIFDLNNTINDNNTENSKLIGNLKDLFSNHQDNTNNKLSMKNVESAVTRNLKPATIKQITNTSPDTLRKRRKYSKRYNKRNRLKEKHFEVCCIN